MAHREVYPTKSGRYGTRMLTAGEPTTVSGPLAREMLALGRATVEKPKKAKPEPAEPVDERVALRAEYETKLGKKPFGGWDADTLREKIDAA